MPNEPLERDRDSRQPHARQVPASAGSSGGSRRRGRGLRKPAGAGVVIVAFIALALAVTGVFASPNRSPDVAAVAGATHAPTDAPTPDPTPEITAEPTEPAAGGDRGAGDVVRTGTVRDAGPDRGSRAGQAAPGAIDEFRAKTGIPGISVAVVWDDGRSWAGATGQRDVGRKLPVATGTAFPLASVSKTLTAAVVLQLVDEGKVDLDAPAARYLPGLQPRQADHRPHAHGPPQQPARLLRSTGRSTARSSGTRTPPGRRRGRGSTCPRCVRSRARSTYYSNTNYLLLGELVEHVTDTPLATEVRTRLLDPLQLTTAWYQGAEEPRRRAPAAIA